MPFEITGNLYNGTATDFAILRAAEGAVTASKNVLFKRPGVKSGLTMRKIGATGAMRTYKSTQTGGDIDLTYEKLNTHRYDVYYEFDPLSLEGEWSEKFLQGPSVLAQLPNNLRIDLINAIMQAHDDDAELALWRGDLDDQPAAGLTGIDQMDGIITLAAAHADTIIIPTPATLTSSNINDKLKLIRAATPVPVLNSSNKRMFMNNKTHQLYGDYLRGLTYKGIGPQDPVPMVFEGIPIAVCPGVPDNTVVVCQASNDPSSNLWYGYSYDQDFRTIQIDKVANNSHDWFVRMTLRVGVGIPKPDELVLYTV